jgi:transposase
MANKSIGMSKLRQIIKLYCHGQGKKRIALEIGVSKNTVRAYIDHFNALRTTWEEISVLSDQELYRMFHPEPEIIPPEKLKNLYAFFPYVEKRLKQRGVTLLQLWQEYIAQYPEGYKSTAFYNHFVEWKKKTIPSMHMEHKAGDKMFVDFAGEKIKIVDEQTGEIKDAEVFVGILGASQYTYVEAVESQKVEDFIGACENALHYFGGSPLAIVPDNLKSAVTKSSKYEPRLNENFERFADHYGMSVIPARAYKPKDKALVEGAVKITYNRIYTNLPKETIPTLSELNKNIFELLEKHNTSVFKGRTYSRREQYNELEKHMMQPLPEKRFEMRNQLVLTVMKNGHVLLMTDKHYYSVPYGYIGKKVRLLYSKSFIEIFYKYELIASHARIKSPHNYTTDPAHLASQHKYLSEWSAEYFLDQAKLIHADVEYYISQVLIKKAHPEQAYRSCNGILSFAKRVGHKRLISACQRAHSYGLYHYQIIETILQKGLDQLDDQDQQQLQMPAHENIRGGNYYQ